MARSNKEEAIKSDVLSLMHTYDPAPPDFGAHEAAPHALMKYGHPRRPDPRREPRLAELWRQAYARPMRYTKAELAIDPIMSRRDPLSHRPAARPRTGSDFRPGGWGGIVVEPSRETINNVFAQWTVPGIFPASDPSGPITAGFWVGIDGFTNGQVLQAGVAVTVSSNPLNVQWWAWTEWYTTQYQDPAVQITNFPVSVGDTVTFLVCAVRPDHGYVGVQNLTTQQATSIGIDARPGITSAGASAEWIVEGISADLPVFLPDVTFTRCASGTRDFSYDLTTGIVTNIQGSTSPLTKASVSSPTIAVVQWEGWT
jgi:hypothetical protein